MRVGALAGFRARADDSRGKDEMRLVNGIIPLMRDACMAPALLGGGGLFAEPFGHLYAYGRPDVLGVESWILPVYFAGGPSVALVSRWLRRGAGGGAGG